DSTSDLAPSQLERYGIEVIPLYVTFDAESYRDGAELQADDLFRKVGEKSKLPKTAAPSPADFINAFSPSIEAGYDILYIALSSELSSTSQNAMIAADEFPDGRVRVFDSLNLSSGIGLQVMKAAVAAEKGKTMDEIMAILESVRKRVETEFIIDTLDYLYMGGRCSGLQHFIGNMLKIRPVVKVVDGKMILASKIRGKREKALQQLLDNALANKDKMDDELVFVTHAKADEEAVYLRETLLRETRAKEVVITEAGCVISSHCGPQTVGILYITNEGA
ncbi:DegV family protein, partial [Gorillibacterium massiliense]|uniref:DegV family protein n=1 Tax=Gorillibacterium massiliense TaxID=1280390 RepID=UPI0005929279